MGIQAICCRRLSAINRGAVGYWYRTALCYAHAAGNGVTSRAIVIPTGWRTSMIASMILGTSSVKLFRIYSLRRDNFNF